MTTSNRSYIALSVAVVFASSAILAHASLIPSLILSSVGNGSQISMAVYGADPNANIMLFYPTSVSMTSANVGTTNSSGYFSATILPSTYNIAIGAPVYILVNGAQSQIVSWPSFTNSNTTSSGGTLTFSQNTIGITAGQSTAISVTSSSGPLGVLSVQSNTNSAVANVSISGTQVIIAANSQGSTAATICSSNGGCGTVTVNVSAVASQSTQNTNQSTITFSQTNVTLNTGQNQIVNLYGPGSYYVSNNSNLGAVSTSLSGSNLTINALNSGTAILSVCANGNNTTSCGTVNVTVNGNNNTATNNNQSSSTVAVSPASIDLSIGQTKSATIVTSLFVTGVYYISTNSSPNTVTADVNGNSLSVVGLAYGASNITVCQQGGTQCGNLYVYVSPNQNGGTVSTPSNVVSTQAPVVTTVSVASNNVNGSFMGNGVTLTVTWGTNQEVAKTSATIAGLSMPVFGSASGPFSAKYTMSGNETMPLPIVLSFTNAAGLSGETKLALGGSSLMGAITVGASSDRIFTQYLRVGSTGPEVTALQNLLTKLGIYSGPVTGKFGALTEAAVKKYQAKHKIDQLGVVGPATRAQLNQGI